MAKNRPLIGIAPAFDYDKNMLYLKSGYYEAVNKAGGLAAVLSITGSEDILDEFIERCDGFLISGGPDIDAKYFGESNLPFTGEISPCRDFAEVYIVKKAVEYKKAVLGICRGMQIMNAAMGGTLYQDIYSQVKEQPLVKHSQEAPRWYPTHEIEIKKFSYVWESFRMESIGVNSFHHQAVKDVAPGFEVTAKAADGIIEAIEHTGSKFTVGVQWHPEQMWYENELYLNIFKQFVKKAGE